MLRDRARLLRALLLAILAGLSGCSTTPSPRIEYGAVTSHPLATQAALRVLDQGGTAADAAVAASAILTLVQPQSAPMGGGQLWLIVPPKGSPLYLDALPAVPADTFSDRPTVQQIAIPGTWAGWDELASGWGRLPRRDLYADAVRLADKGVPGHSPRPDLGRFFKALQLRGRKGVYSGPFSDALQQAVTREGGRWRAEDLSAYRTKRSVAQSLTLNGWSGTWHLPPLFMSTLAHDLAAFTALMAATDARLPLNARLALTQTQMTDAWRESPLVTALHASVPVSSNWITPHIEEIRQWTRFPPPPRHLSRRPEARCGQPAAGLVIQDRNGLRIASTFWQPYAGMQRVATGEPGPGLFVIGTDAHALRQLLSPGSHLPTRQAPALWQSETGTALVAATHPQSPAARLWLLAQSWTRLTPARLWQSRPVMCAPEGRWVQVEGPVQKLAGELAPISLSVVRGPSRAHVQILMSRNRAVGLQALTEHTDTGGRAITRILRP